MDTRFDLAILALKGKRYQEAETIYTNIATDSNSSEAWIGLGFCKLNQLAEGRTMDEVTYCLNKAISINSTVKEQVEDQLIGSCVVLLSTYSQLYDKAIAKDRELKKKAAIGAFVASVSIISGFSSNSAFGALASAAGTGAGIGIAIDSLEKIKDVGEFQSFLTTICASINQEVLGFVSPSNPKIEDYKKFISQLLICADFKAKMNVHIGNEDLIRASYLSNNYGGISFKNFKENEAGKKELQNLMKKYGIDQLELGKLINAFKKTPLHL